MKGGPALLKMVSLSTRTNLAELVAVMKHRRAGWSIWKLAYHNSQQNGKSLVRPSMVMWLIREGTTLIDSVKR